MSRFESSLKSFREKSKDKMPYGKYRTVLYDIKIMKNQYSKDPNTGELDDQVLFMYNIQEGEFENKNILQGITPIDDNSQAYLFAVLHILAPNVDYNQFEELEDIADATRKASCGDPFYVDYSEGRSEKGNKFKKFVITPIKEE